MASPLFQYEGDLYSQGDIYTQSFGSVAEDNRCYPEG